MRAKRWIVIGPFKRKLRDRAIKGDVDRALIRPIVGISGSEHDRGEAGPDDRIETRDRAGN